MPGTSLLTLFSTCLLAILLGIPLQSMAQTSSGYMAAEATLTSLSAAPVSDDYFLTVHLATASIPWDSAKTFQLTIAFSQALPEECSIGAVAWHGGVDGEDGDSTSVALSRNRKRLTLTLSKSSYVDIEPGTAICSLEVSETGIYPGSGFISLVDGIVELEVTIGVKIPTASDETAVRLSPNPTSGSLQIDFGIGDWSSLEIIDLEGQVLLTADAHAVRRLDVRFLPRGLYFLRLRSEEGDVVTLKFIKR